MSVCLTPTMDVKVTDKISKMKIVPLQQSKYMKPFKVEFEMNGLQKYWDLLKVHDSVSILIYNTSRKAVVLVKQFRPSMYVAQAAPNLETGLDIDTTKHPLHLGYSLELCAGIVDKEASIEQIAKEEVLEECGYDVPVTSLQLIFSCRSVGIMGNLQSIFYVEVTDSQRVSSGGGLIAEGEFIEVVELTVPQLRQYMDSKEIQSPTGFVAAVQWFLNRIDGNVAR